MNDDQAIRLLQALHAGSTSEAARALCGWALRLHSRYIEAAATAQAAEERLALAAAEVEAAPAEAVPVPAAPMSKADRRQYYKQYNARRAEAQRAARVAAGLPVRAAAAERSDTQVGK